MPDEPNHNLVAKKPRWQRVLLMPIVCIKFYKLLLPFLGPWDAGKTAVECTLQTLRK